MATRSVVLDEQRNLTKQHGDKIDHDILSKMDVLYGCIKEAHRLRSPVPLILRSSHTNFSVKTPEGKEYDIPKHHMVATLPIFVNQLLHIYKDPDSYDPDSFAAGRKEDKKAGDFSYISFGGGGHGCLGEFISFVSDVEVRKTLWEHNDLGHCVPPRIDL